MSKAQEILVKIADQRIKMKVAAVSGFHVDLENERMKNLLLNNLDDIVEVLTAAAVSEKRIGELEADLQSADEELKELDDEIKKLRSAATSKAAAKGKPKAKAEPAEPAGND